MRSDGRIAAAIAALGQNVIEGRRQRHPPVNTANHKPVHRQPPPLQAHPSQGHPSQARRDDSTTSSTFNAVSSPTASSAMPTQHKPRTLHTHHQVTLGQLARVTAVDPPMQSAIRRHRSGSAPLARTDRRNIAAQLEQHAAVYEELCAPYEHEYPKMNLRAQASPSLTTIRSLVPLVMGTHLPASSTTTRTRRPAVAAPPTPFLSHMIVTL